MLPLVVILELADLLVTRGLSLYTATQDLPAEGTPEDRAKIEALRTKLGVTNELVQSLPILPPPDAPGVPHPPGAPGA